MNVQNSDQDKPNRTRMVLLPAGLALVLILPVLCLILLGVGQINGVEFSPDDFSRRSFSYNQMPLTGWVVRNKVYRDQTSDLEKSLTADRLIRSVILKKKRWHLVSELGSSEIPHQCDARFLTGYLEKLDDDGNNYWDTWNTDYPKCAKVFWPEVAELARDEMYLKIADVMRVAINVSKDDPVPLGRELKAVLSDVYLELGTLDIELGLLERAAQRLEKSIQHDPNSKAAEKLESIESQIESSPNDDSASQNSAGAQTLPDEALK